MRWEFRAIKEQAHDQVSRGAFLDQMVEFLEDVTHSDWVIWIAALDGELAAHIFVRLVEKVPKPGKELDCFAYITNVYTRPAYRNQGIGSRLMKKVVDWAKEIDCEFLLVWPSEESINYYQRAGFVPEKEAMVIQLRKYIP